MSIAGKGYVRPVYVAGITVGTTLTSTATSSSASIPNDSTGKVARQVLLTAGGVANPAVHVRFFPSVASSSTTATANDLMIGSQPLAIWTRGNDTLAVIQDTAATKLNVAPIEDA